MPAPFGPSSGEQLAAPHLEVDAVERDGFAVALGGVDELGERLRAREQRRSRLGSDGQWNRRGRRRSDAKLAVDARRQTARPLGTRWTALRRRGRLISRIPPAVQDLADPRRAHEIVIAHEQHGRRDREDQRELDRPVQRHLRERGREEEHDGQVREIQPVRRVGQIAAHRAFVRAEFERRADDAEAPVPDRQDVAGGVRRRGPSGAVVEPRSGRAGFDARDRVIDDKERETDREITEPALAPLAEQFELAVHEPAEHERGAEADERGYLRNQAAVGCRNAAHQQDPVVEPQHREQRRSEHERSGVAAEQRAHGLVERAAHAPGRVERHDHRTHREQQHVEDAEIVEEPQMRERKGTGGHDGRIPNGGGDGRVRTARDAPDQRADRERREDHPAHEHWRQDSLRAIRDEAARAAPLDHEPREQARDKEERGHAPRVDQGEQYGERRALRDVVRRNRQKERHRRVQHDAGEQRESADRVEGMETFLLGHG